MHCSNKKTKQKNNTVCLYVPLGERRTLNFWKEAQVNKDDCSIFSLSRPKVQEMITYYLFVLRKKENKMPLNKYSYAPKMLESFFDFLFFLMFPYKAPARPKLTHYWTEKCQGITMNRFYLYIYIYIYIYIYYPVECIAVCSICIYMHLLIYTYVYIYTF